MHVRAAFAAGVAILVGCAAHAYALSSFVTFESGQVRPLALSPLGDRLYAVNTPDNRLEVFQVDAGGLTHLESVPVGLEPVAVAARSDDEVWVVNHLSDSISIVDTSSSPARVTRTLLVGDEPRDIVFAGPTEGGMGTPFTRAFVTCAHRGQNNPNPPNLTTEGIGRADVWVFDATSLGAGIGGDEIAIITLFGDTPRALAATADGSRVYAAVFQSGNQTTTVSEGAVCDGGSGVGPCGLDGITVPGGLAGGMVPGGLPAPNRNVQGSTGPETGLIVKFNPSSGHWEDGLGRNWHNAVRFSLPDLDVFTIDADAATPVATGGNFAGVGTILFNMIVNPSNGKVYVTNTEARNEVRFEGPGSLGSTVRGHLHEARITVLDGADVLPRHLNKHIDYGAVPVPAGVKEKSLATPTGMALSSTGTLYVAAFGSSAVGVFSATAVEDDTFVPSAGDHIPVSGGGPSGLVLDEVHGKLYVLTRFDNSISVVDVGTRSELAHLPLFNPEPPSVVNGRRFLYDATFTSSNGEASCSSCHVFGDFDSLGWDLGNPDDVVSSNPNPFPVIGSGAPFHPMKGPMATQTLRGMANHGPMHWRGDRTGGNATPPGSPLDESLAFNAFNVAFGGLLGRDEGPIPTDDMQAFTDFILQVILPPNPIRPLSNTPSASAQIGRDFYLNQPGSDVVASCNGCHVLDPARGFFGTDGGSSFENEVQELKVPHLNNVYQKVGMFGMAAVPFFNSGDNGFKGDQIRGFGFLHDGSTDTLLRFHRAAVFFFPGGDAQRSDVEQFMFEFDTTLAPIVGQQVTLTSANAAAVEARIDQMIQRATTPYPLVDQPGATECDLVVKSTIDGRARGWVMDNATELFTSDKSVELPLSDAALRALAITPGRELTYTCVPPGSGQRIGIDRDEDGRLDNDPPPACAASPLVSCATANRSLLMLRNRADDTRDRLVWKWLRGPTTDVRQFGDPASTTDYSLCLYDGGGPLLEVDVPAVAGSWRATATPGFQYSDRTRAAHGTHKILLRSTAGNRASITFVGNGERLPDDYFLGGVLAPVTAQLVNSDGECWTAQYEAADFIDNDAELFMAKRVN